MKGYLTNTIIVIFIITIIIYFFKKKRIKNPIKMNSEFYPVVKPLKIRDCDSKGCGYYGASRGGRKHKGVDIIAKENQTVNAPISGRVRTLYVYKNSLNMTGVEITNSEYSVKIFYVENSFSTGKFVEKGESIGKVQNVAKYHNAEGEMVNHVHVEVRVKGNLINPTNLIK